MSLLADIGTVRSEIDMIDAMLAELPCIPLKEVKEGPENAKNVLRMLWGRVDIAHNEEDTPLDVTDLEHVSRTVIKVLKYLL